MRKVSESLPVPSVVDLIRRGRCNLVVNTPGGGPDPRSDGYLIREAALTARVPCITTRRRRDGGRPRDRERARRDRAVAAGTDRCRGPGASVVESSPSRRSARTRSSASRGARSIQGSPDSSSCSRRPAACCRGRCRSASRRRGELAFLLDPVGPGTRALAALEPGDELHVFGPLGNGFRLDVERPLLVGGGIGIAPLPYLAEALEHPPAVLGFRSAAPRRSGGAAAERRGRDRSRARHRRDAARSRRARLRAGADARSGARDRARRAARVGGADGLRVRRLLRLRRRDRR